MPKAASIATRKGKAATARSNPLSRPAAKSTSGNGTETSALSLPSNESGTSIDAPSGLSNAVSVRAATATLTMPASDANYLFSADVANIEFPRVSRLLSIPPTFTFEQVHRVMQIAFGWASCHAYSFDVFETAELGTLPGPSSFVPKLNIVMMMDGFTPFGMEEDRSVGMDDITLQEVYEDPSFEGKPRVVYNYDFGDGWEHDLTLIGRETPGSRALLSIPEGVKVFCMSGEGHSVAEDCGGPPGWEELKDNFKRTTRRGQDDRRDWYKKYCANGDPKGLDPYKWDLLKLNQALVKEFSPQALGQAKAKSKGNRGRAR